MRIFYPLQVFYPSQAGGTANCVYFLTKNLVERGFEPKIIATDQGTDNRVELNRWLDTESGRTIFIKTRFQHIPLLQTVTSILYFRRAEIVHLSSIFYPTAFITAFAARLAGKKVIWSPHGELADYALKHSARRKRPILWAIKTFIGKYPTYHSTSPDETQTIRNVFGDVLVHEIPNYIEI